MHRTSFGQENKKRILCIGSEKMPTCRQYLTVLYRNQIGKSIAKVCKNCGTIWVLKIEEGPLENSKFGVTVKFTNQDIVKSFTSPY